MRGKVLERNRKLLHHGITPAYAGKRRTGKLCRGWAKDHPRVCGEKSDGLKLTVSISGSPPRMRGKGDEVWRQLDELGITPAYAGKSIPLDPPIQRTEDHPRVCGEKVILSAPCQTRTGSPPRMRGKEERNKRNSPLLRITPAYAGKRNS